MDLERQISGLALELVKTKQASGGSEYRSFCEGFPTLLRSAGLAQTLAFLKAKGGCPHGDVYSHLEKHFEGLLATVTDPRTLTPQYRLYSQLALRMAFWHKRLAQALLEKRP
jgi:CRISPR/Cas system CMR-associated protein Cmr5 small subunit